MRLFILFAFICFSFSGKYHYQIGLLKYNGGGDWYANLETSLPNLIKYANEHLGTKINPEQAVVEVGSAEIFNYPLVHMTGHGNIIFSNAEALNLRNYILAGGFLHIDDNYGMDKFVRREMKKVFPEYDFVDLPDNHPIYKSNYVFEKGLPKIHEHDEKPSRGLGIVHQGRLLCYYTMECDLGDGWESKRVHGDSDQVRQKALKMGTNIIAYAFLGMGFE